MVREHSDAGAAVLVSTHYMDEAEQADRLVVMANGRVAGRGTVADIVAGRQVVEVRAPDWRAALAAVERDERVVLLDGRAIRILGDEVPAVRADLRRASIEAEVRLVPASLNEALVELSRAAASRARPSA
jgi:ABC-type multidrug transport system ATPase subunit